MEQLPALPGDVRQEQRQAALPGVYRTAHERLAVELAMQMNDPADIFEQHGLSIAEGVALMETPTFLSLLQRISKELKESGTTFRAKARMMAEELLPCAFDLARDPQISSAVRLDAAKSVVKWAGLEPATKDDGKTAGGGLTLSITFAGAQPEKVIATQELPALENGA